MRTVLISFLICLLPALCPAQKENNIWTFGYHLGLDFNAAAAPGFMRDSCNTLEGAAAVCDTGGHLLFYSDGVRAFDRNHRIMPNGNSLLGNSSSTQGVAIASVPGEDSVYYLFTIGIHAGSLGKGYFSYSLVDLRLNSGFGDIGTGKKNIMVDSNMSEKMIIVGHCSQWVLVHHIDSPMFLAYPITGAGLLSPVVSREGPYRGVRGFSMGELKVSPDLTRLASVLYNATATIELFDFEVSTGKVSNVEVLDSMTSRFALYGVEFSADGSRLYATRPDSGSLLQYDLSLSTAAARRASRYGISTGTSRFFALRRGPDDMIYTTPNTPANFSRVRAPNLLGALCDFEKDFLSTPLTGSLGNLGLGNYFVPREGEPGDTSHYTHAKFFCSDSSLNINSRVYGTDPLWSDGDTAILKTFATAGTYWLQSDGNCGVRIDTFHISEMPLDTSYQLARDTAVCLGKSVTITIAKDRERPRWSDGDTARIKTLIPPMYLTLRSRRECHVFVDSFVVRLKPDDSAFTLSADMDVCADKTATLSMPPLREDPRWSDGSTAPARSVHPPALLYLRSRKDCITYTDTFRIRLLKIDTVYHLHDTAVCTGEKVTWSGPPGADDYSWSDGSTVMSRTITPPVKLLLRSRIDCQLIVDTFRADTISSTATAHRTDTMICPGSPLLLKGRTGADSYLWDDGSTGAERSVSARPGSYWVRSRLLCASTTDTFHVAEKPFDVLYRETDSSICFRDSATINGPAGYSNYLWNAGNMGKDTTLTGTADLVVVATDSAACRMLRQEYHILFVDKGNPIPDTFICNEDSVLLVAGLDDATYRWSNGSTTAAAQYGRAGLCWVHISRNGCTYTDTISIDQKELQLHIGGDRQICKEEHLVLEADVTDADAYLWSNGSTGKSIEVTQSGHYVLTIEKDGCTSSDKAMVNFVNCDNCIAFANAFTPNHDGLNDFFKPLMNCPPKSYELSIYNRWGQEVFHTLNPVDAWDGNNRGLPEDGNVYFYALRVSFEGQQEAPQLYKGEVTLIR